MADYNSVLGDDDYPPWLTASKETFDDNQTTAPIIAVHKRRFAQIPGEEELQAPFQWIRCTFRSLRPNVSIRLGNGRSSIANGGKSQ
ncbi:hypothetical protein R1sor_011792 [Riccia sorocarpa]|uniref:Uncharacterized protein n=1 Tax=Riccia sorocarpa TaxID=122646 RepID=A0ABD3I2X6_9MARC